MSDPISPVGSPGQLSSMTPIPATYSSPSAGDAGVVQVSERASAQAQAKATASAQGVMDAVHLQAAQAATKRGTKPAASPMSVEDAVKAFREFVKNFPSDLQFRPDKESGYVIIKVVNPLTQEVIRQYPPDEIVEMAKKLKAAAEKNGSGIFLDRKA